MKLGWNSRIATEPKVLKFFLYNPRRRYHRSCWFVHMPVCTKNPCLILHHCLVFFSQPSPWNGIFICKLAYPFNFYMLHAKHKFVAFTPKHLNLGWTIILIFWGWSFLGENSLSCYWYLSPLAFDEIFPMLCWLPFLLVKLA